MIVITSLANMSGENEPAPAHAAAPAASDAPDAAAEDKPEEDANKPDENNEVVVLGESLE